VADKPSEQGGCFPVDGRVKKEIKNREGFLM
jgi:hypothetical protein